MVTDGELPDLRRGVELACDALESGDEPFGSVCRWGRGRRDQVPCEPGAVPTGSRAGRCCAARVVCSAGRGPLEPGCRVSR